MDIKHQAETNAGFVAPSPSWFIVTRTHGHETLKVGDLVRVVEDPLCRNWIYRRDATLHELRGDDDCYVELQLAMFTIEKEGPLPQEPSTVHLPDQPCSLTSDKSI
jgi:hypothetical protein